MIDPQRVAGAVPGCAGATVNTLLVLRNLCDIFRWENYYR
jgi:hypothetical protein